MSTKDPQPQNDIGVPTCRRCNETLTPGYSFEAASGTIVEEFRCDNCGATGRRRSGGTVGYSEFGQAFALRGVKDGV